MGVRTGKDRGYTWELEIAEYEGEEGAEEFETPLLVMPLTIRVRVSWGNRDQSVELVTLRLVERDDGL